jgi:hypothetical protein
VFELRSISELPAPGGSLSPGGGAIATKGHEFSADSRPEREAQRVD